MHVFRRKKLDIMHKKHSIKYVLIDDLTKIAYNNLGCIVELAYNVRMLCILYKT